MICTCSHNVCSTLTLLWLLTSLSIRLSFQAQVVDNYTKVIQSKPSFAEPLAKRVAEMAYRNILLLAVEWMFTSLANFPASKLSATFQILNNRWVASVPPAFCVQGWNYVSDELTDFRSGRQDGSSSYLFSSGVAWEEFVLMGLKYGRFLSIRSIFKR